MDRVYGSFIDCFPELLETFDVWLKDDKSDLRKVVGMFIPTKGSGIRRRKYTSGNTALDVTESDVLYIRSIYKDKIHPGDYISNNTLYIYKLIKNISFDRAADFVAWTFELVTGTTINKTEQLTVKEGRFA